MTTIRILLVVVLALFLAPDTHGFIPTKKKSADRRAAFAKQKNSNGNKNEEEGSAAAAQTQYKPAPSPTAAFSVPPSAMVAAIYDYEEDEEEDVPYEVALVSCIISLAIGFGTGYLV
eukprot:CAMPEP_0201129088 /NCGR_PEP_ID=MMETSP0850-20130426/35792_1 /ASSEMBLY_ACC=CAM_ASM_000622 /TAXON_ID=183588 /ORGANISM="Pseudo-nitzschia fraudulenta, Strain WWA7" /LENGTH=116 /DNA_ID=CAMNT_0047398471 /DNA_START=60 /DNA_END=410 /DNA_ORIENTATION=-